MRRNSDPRINEGSLWHLHLLLSMLEDMVHTTWFIILAYCWVQGPLSFKEGKKKSGQWYFKGLWIGHLKTWFSGRLGSAGLMVGFNDPRGLFQPKQPCDSVIRYNQKFIIKNFYRFDFFMSGNKKWGFNFASIPTKNTLRKRQKPEDVLSL